MVERDCREIKEKNKLIALIGPTASSKTSKAVGLAKVWNAEIISGDSRQVYKKMDLGTGKDLDEYEDIPYHLIDICEPGEKYNLHGFVRDFKMAVTDIEERNKNCILCGGSGMYVETVLANIDLPEVPENTILRRELESKTLIELENILRNYKALHNTTDIDTKKRAIRAIEIEEYYKKHPEEAIKADKNSAQPLKSLIIGLEISREERRKRITDRLHARLEKGMVQEVKDILDKGVPPEDLIYYGLEYKYLTLYIIGQLSYSEMVSGLEIAIHQFAKRQMTWFRGMEKRGFTINWLPYDLPQEEFNERVLQMLRSE